jgi:hypothetical protein
MLNLTNPIEFISSVNNYCNAELISTHSKNTCDLELIVQDNIRQHMFRRSDKKTWTHGKEILTIKDKNHKSVLAYVIKYNLGDLLWFEFYLPSTKKPILTELQNLIKHCFDSLCYVEGPKFAEVNSFKNYSLWDKYTKNAGKSLFLLTFLPTLPILTIMVYQLYKVDKSFADFLLTSINSGFITAWLILKSTIYLTKTKFNSRVYPPDSLFKFLNTLEVEANQKILDNNQNQFCFLELFSIHGNRIQDISTFYYGKTYIITDKLSCYKVAEVVINYIDNQYRFIITPYLPSDSKYPYLHDLNLSILAIENKSYEYNQYQLVNEEVIQLNSKIFLETYSSFFVPFTVSGTLFTVITSIVYNYFGPVPSLNIGLFSLLLYAFSTFVPTVEN